MSICASGGKVLVVRISEAGEVLGLSAALSGEPYELSAETSEPCQLGFVRRDDLLRLLKNHVSVCLAVAEQLSEKYRTACQKIRALARSHAEQRLAKLILEWNDTRAEGQAADHLDLTLTQDAIGQAIGTSRETVVRLLADFKKRQIIAGSGSSIVIRDELGLKNAAEWRNRRGN